MIRHSVFRILLTGALVLLPGHLDSQINGFSKITWKKERIAPGLTWKWAHTKLNDSILQNINILVVNTNKRAVSLSYKPGINRVLSKQAADAGAIAAVNAGFFNIKEGGSVTYVRSGGVIAETDTAKKWTRNTNMTGSLLIDSNGHIVIDRAYSNYWYDSHQEYPEVLVTGPLLLKDKVKAILPSTPLVVKKHPRTVVGKKGSHRIVILTLDGRTDQARGMTLDEMSEFMILLHCKDAINLDGGGSTTMWILGKPSNGIVNMPCDNKKFDHEGERAVADILIIK